MRDRFDSSAWRAGSARVDGNEDSWDPSWLLFGFRGRQWVEILSGPLVVRVQGEAIAAVMNRIDPARWDHFIEFRMPALVTWSPMVEPVEAERFRGRLLAHLVRPVVSHRKGARRPPSLGS